MLLLYRLAALGQLLDLLALGLGHLLLTLAAELQAVMGLVPLAEGRGVYLDDGRLGQGVGAHQLVIGRVVDYANDAGLAGAALRTPSKVARVEAEGAVLVIAAAGADDVDSLGADAGHARLPGLLESSLLPCREKVRTQRPEPWEEGVQVRLVL